MDEVFRYIKVNIDCYIVLQFVLVEQIVNGILGLRVAQEGSLALFSATVVKYFKKIQLMSKCPY